MSKITFIFILVLFDVTLFFLPKKLRLKSTMMNAVVNEVPFGKAIVKFISSAYLFFAKIAKISFYILTIILLILLLSYLFKHFSKKMKKVKTVNNEEFSKNLSASNSGGEVKKEVRKEVKKEVRKDTAGMNYF